MDVKRRDNYNGNHLNKVYTTWRKAFAEFGKYHIERIIILLI